MSASSPPKLLSLRVPSLGLAQATVKVAGRELELSLTARQMASIDPASLFLPSAVRKSDAGHWDCQAEALASHKYLILSKHF